MKRAGTIPGAGGAQKSKARLQNILTVARRIHPALDRGARETHVGVWKNRRALVFVAEKIPAILSRPENRPTRLVLDAKGLGDILAAQTGINSGERHAIKGTAPSSNRTDVVKKILSDHVIGVHLSGFLKRRGILEGRQPLGCAPAIGFVEDRCI